MMSQLRLETERYLGRRFMDIRPERSLNVGAGKEKHRRWIPSGAKVVNLDRQAFSGIDVVHDFNSGLPFPDRDFDLVILSNVLEHAPNPFHLMAESARVLAPDGQIIGVVPFLTGLHQEPYDFYRFTRYGIERLLSSAEFEVLDITPLGRLTDVYLGAQGTIFWELVKDGSLRWRAIWKAQRAFNRLFGLKSERGAVGAFCEGFGFSARKPAKRP